MRRIGGFDDSFVEAAYREERARELAKPSLAARLIVRGTAAVILLTFTAGFLILAGLVARLTGLFVLLGWHLPDVLRL